MNILKHRTFRILLVPAIILALGFFIPNHASASPLFNYTDYPINDSAMRASSTMSTSDIQNFLQSHGSGLASFTDIETCGSTSGSHYSFYASYYSCGSRVSAAKIIFDSAQAYGINPQSILATLQKEQSLITTPNPVSSQLNFAMGYGCPDSGGCSVAGFFNQVDNGTWQFRVDMELVSGNSYWGYGPSSYPCNGPTRYYNQALKPGNDVTFIDDNGIGYTHFVIPNAATAALYCYTPHVYPGSSQEYYSGSKNFVYYFNLWFVPYLTSYYAQSAYPSIDPGQQANVWIEYQNRGNQTWYDDSSIGTAPVGSYPIHLATSHILNRSSAFGSTWPSSSRAAVNFSAVYNSDGSTLSSNQHVALPGQIVKFSFNITAPSGLTAATYPEYFQPIAEGTSDGALNDPGTNLLVTVNAVPAVSYVGQSAYPTIQPGTSSNAFLLLKNSGSSALYDDASIGNAPNGSYPVHLATSNPLNHSSIFSKDWPNSSRAAVNFSAVYNSDGSTLSSNQHVALPGQIVKFSFNLSTTSGLAASTYHEYFQPILEGTAGGGFTNLGISWDITVPQAPVFQVTNMSPGVSLSSNEPSQITLLIKNIGNAIASNSTVLKTGGVSPLATPTWVSSSVIRTLPQSLAPGDSVSITVTVLAPSTTSSITSTLGCVFTDGSTNIVTSSNCAIPIPVSGTSYRATSTSTPATQSLAPNQISSVAFIYKNTGNQPWYDDSSVVSATWRTPLPIHLATAQSINRSSGFASGWPNSSRAAVNFSAVYNSDGSTLASDQHVALPGQIVKFSFNLSPQSWIHPGNYPEYFQPIVEGTSDGAINPVATYVSIAVQPSVYSASYYNQSSYPSLDKGQQTTSFFSYRNTGNQTWYDDSSIGTAPAGSYPVHLATSHIINRLSAFGPTWPNSSRAAVNFSAVYNSDGSTLASDQHVALPGQIVKFSFNMTAPASGLAAATYPEYFQLVAEGTPNGAFNDLGTNLLVTVK